MEDQGYIELRKGDWMKPTGQLILPPNRDNETLAAAIKRYEEEKAERELLLVNQGKLEGGLYETKI